MLCGCKPDRFLNLQLIIFELISTVFMIIASILIILQGFDNDKFRNNKTREAKIEKFLYSQFSNEVYSNILSKPFRNSSCSSAKDLTAEIKINSSFDRRGVKDDELNENVCQDRIINNNWTCCRPDCCYRTNGGEIKCNDYNFDIENPVINNNKILTYDLEEYFEDPRRRLCTYYNKYDGQINKFLNQTIKICTLSYNYEDLLLNKVDYACIGKSCKQKYKDCGIIDTMYRHLYLSN